MKRLNEEAALVTSDIIREARERLAETQWEFAERLGLNQATISRWENGRLPVGGPGRILLQRVLQDIDRVHPKVA